MRKAQRGKAASLTHLFYILWTHAKNHLKRFANNPFKICYCRRRKHFACLLIAPWCFSLTQPPKPRRFYPTIIITFIAPSNSPFWLCWALASQSHSNLLCVFCRWILPMSHPLVWNQLVRAARPFYRSKGHSRAQLLFGFQKCTLSFLKPNAL